MTNLKFWCMKKMLVSGVLALAFTSGIVASPIGAPVAKVQAADVSNEPMMVHLLMKLSTSYVAHKAAHISYFTETAYVKKELHCNPERIKLNTEATMTRMLGFTA